MLVFFSNLAKSYGISGQIFDLSSSVLSNRQLHVVLDEKSSQEYPVNPGVSQGSILGPTLQCCIQKKFGTSVSAGVFGGCCKPPIGESRTEFWWG